MLRTLVVSALVGGLALVPGPASAKGKDKGRGKGHGHGRDADVVVFTDRDRGSVRTYWVETYGHGNCPPGLAKKNNGCLPPGLAKKRYVVGQRLPTAVVVQPLPQVLVTRLGPPVPGYEYVMVDGDIVKLAVGTRLVVDAIRAVVD